MPIERPTFHESWYRVENLHPPLHSTVQVSRQHFRGQQWHVVQDHSNNMFFRLAEPAYRYIGLLDGKRSVGDAWRIANETLGDDAPTQGEVIQLLGQLYTGNLLQADVTADTQTLFARYKKRKHREITSYLMNIMFSRIPILDPDNFLNKTLPIFGWIFSPIGFVVWIILIAMGIHSITSFPNWSAEIARQQNGLLSPQNLILLYIAFALIKGCHEMGHAISCKKFGKQAGTGGEVHIIGIMLLIFTPVPYVDASSSWAVPNKWHRAIVGAAGMWVELAIASVGALIWAGTQPETALHAFAYNIMFVAGFSTIVFNANPLLRYDGYYILSDILEIPNLAQRGKEYIYYLVKKYVWNVRHARNPAHSRTEKAWLFVYAIASFVMRVFVTFSIMFYLSGVLTGPLIIVATAMTLAGLITWVCVPTGKFIHYLWTNGELHRVRSRAILTSILFFGGLVGLLGFAPLPGSLPRQGVIEPMVSENVVNLQQLYLKEAGRITYINLNGQPERDPIAARLGMPSVKMGDLVMQAQRLDLERELEQAEAELRAAIVDAQQAMASNPDLYDFRLETIRVKKEDVSAKESRLGQLRVEAPLSGILVMPEMEEQRFGYIKQGDRLGIVADLHNLIVRAAARNELFGNLKEEQLPNQQVEIRVQGRPDILFAGEIFQTNLSGSNSLPSPALGYQMGGEFNTATDDRQGTKTTENFFEIRIHNLKPVKGEVPKEIWDRFEQTGDISLLPGQVVVVRFQFHSKPLAVQAWTKLRQAFQKNFSL